LPSPILYCTTFNRFAIFAQIQVDMFSNDALPHAGALLQSLQHSPTSRDISSVSKSTYDEIIASPVSVIWKKLAFKLICCTHFRVFR
jgi:hypothetical protein